MNKFLLLLNFLLFANASLSQDAVRHRLILIGDAGAINTAQQLVIEAAVKQVIPGRTTVLFLGDNIYPRGMGLPGSPEEADTREILRAQYVPFRNLDVPVYFIPGNHDWDKSGPNGLAKILKQGQFLQEQNDSLLQLIPADGCPDPVEIHLTDSAVLIALDSEWWLFPYEKMNPEADCECRTKSEVTERLAALFYANRHKQVILATHHPFQTYGVHGGRFSFKDHLFPLTNANKNLYIPLPGVGSLYPVLRSVFAHTEDKGHPLYRNMISRITKEMDLHPNIIQVSGHEHGLQFIKDKHIQVVSGSGAKHSATYMGKHSLFATADNGFVFVDIMEGNSLNIRFITESNKGLAEAFQYNHQYAPRRVMEQTEISKQPDSIIVAIRPSYDSVSGFHRILFGENYRKEWATPVKLPVFRISDLNGGLRPTQRGGGMQTISLRLEDKNKEEWVLRSVEKVPDVLLPNGLGETFARDWIDDAMSAQHPFSALMVPPLANAVGVPHSSPVIGWLAPDSLLGIHNAKFSGKVFLLEKREPLGKSDNTGKMLKKIMGDNDDQFDGIVYFRAMLLDLLMGDWDRHEDQWRWADQKKGKNKNYWPVPRDRDQVLHKTEGLFPKMASRPWLVPTLQGFGSTIPSVKYSLFKNKFLYAYPWFQFSEATWEKEVNRFVLAITDSVLHESIRQLPETNVFNRKKELFEQLRSRRDKIPEAMRTYRNFIYKKTDIRASDKNEWVHITEKENGVLAVTLQKIDKNGKLEDKLMYQEYHPQITREIRLYLGHGRDSVTMEKISGKIKLRIIGGENAAALEVKEYAKKVKFYGQPGNLHLYGNTEKLKTRFSNDGANTAFVPVNLYNFWMPLISAGINVDDGLILGGGFRYTGKSGFRKLPYTHIQEFVIAHSFSTGAYRIRYKSNWNQLLGKADLVFTTTANAPNNTINFFGRGNETEYRKAGNHLRFHRTRFATYQLEPLLQWRRNQGMTLYVGPSLQYYRFDADDNEGRFILQTNKVGSYDSTSIEKNKFHAGFIAGFKLDRRNTPLLPEWGYEVGLKMLAYGGINTFAENYFQLIPEISVYNKLNARSTIVMANKIGGGITFGEPAFYQSLFLGGQGNLLGYRQFRFAGLHSFYHNLEFRIKLASVASYILPGQLGFIAFNDLGRVWTKNEISHRWHHGAGGGFYFSPAGLTVFNLLFGHSNEGWYPYFSMGLRF